jgi:peptide/nickel transport system substrate-binding protein/oligopeptide transport system substrate-binding protein
VGSGPYKLKSWSQTKVGLVRNPYYSGPRPAIDQITISLSPLPDTGTYDYLTKTLDVTNFPGYDRTLVGQPGIREARKLAIDGIYMNVHKKPFGNRDVRRALTLALNRPALVTAAMGKSATPFKGYVPMDQPGYDAGLKTLSHNAKQAVAELKAGGYSDPKKFPQTTLYYFEDPAVAKLARGIVTAWRKTLHITIATQPLTLNTLVANIQANKLGLYLFGWAADYPDPHDWLSLQWETGALDNNVRYHNAAFDRLVQSADVTWNRTNRMRLYNQAQQMLTDDAAWIPMYIPHRLVYVRPTVTNLSVTGYGLIPQSGNWARVQVRKASASRRSRLDNAP